MKFDQIDWELAKADIAPFIADQRRLDIWSSRFFHDIIEHLEIQD